jgi:predicted DsbA family dithiol-disulfide isomerase
MLFDGKLALVGAQGVETYRDTLLKITEERSST